MTSPVVSMVNSGKLVIWVIASVILAEVLKNVVYDPDFLGAAAKLHLPVVLIEVWEAACCLIYAVHVV